MSLVSVHISFVANYWHSLSWFKLNWDGSVSGPVLISQWSLADLGLNDRTVEKGLKASLALLRSLLQFLSQELTLIKITLLRYREDSLECEWKWINHLWPCAVCFYEPRGTECVSVRVCEWKDRAKLICVCELGGVCVYAVTLPLIQLSKLLSVAREWQGFHSTVVDTQTHNSLSVFACLHKSSFYSSEFHGVSLSLCLCVSAVWII